jgi:hypothetical protein
MRKQILVLAAAMSISVPAVWAGKQKIIVRLREPLKAETVKIRLPETKNLKGETRDLEAQLELGNKPRQEAPKFVAPALKLDMMVRSVGKGAVQVTLTLPQPGYMELVVLDFYGKHLATLLAAQMTPGVYPLKAFDLKDGDGNGIKFMTLRINGKVALKRMMTKVR